MEGIAINQVVGLETVERPFDFADPTPNLHYLERISQEARYGDELYGLGLALEYGVRSPELAMYLGVQELTHVQEGLELQQQDSTDFPFVGGEVIDPITKKPMLAMAEDGHESQVRAFQNNQGFDFMMVRTEHDTAIAKDNNQRMAKLPVGSAWVRFTPFAEEETINDARKAGFWTETRRAYGWAYRKKSETELEATIISIDKSSVEAFAGLMHEHGTNVPIDVTSHDIPGFVVEIEELIENEDQRDQFITNLKTRYKELAEITEAPGIDLTSKEFIEQFAIDELASLARLQLEIISSLETDNLAPYVREAGRAVLDNLGAKHLSTEELRAIMLAVNTNKPIKNIEGLRLIMKAHRYGVWESIDAKIKSFASDNFTVGSQLATRQQMGAGGQWSLEEALNLQQQRLGYEADQTERAQLNNNGAHAQSAAEQGKVKPGCPGGSSFLSQTEGEAKESIFGGKEKDPKRWMSCPFCKKEKAVYARACDANLKCRHCPAEVRGGKVVNKGNGGETESEQSQTQESSAVVIDMEMKRQEKIAIEAQQEPRHEQPSETEA